ARFPLHHAGDVGREVLVGVDPHVAAIVRKRFDVREAMMAAEDGVRVLAEDLLEQGCLNLLAGLGQLVERADAAADRPSDPFTEHPKQETPDAHGDLKLEYGEEVKTTDSMTFSRRVEQGR